jgi:prevent-host-death family protein
VKTATITQVKNGLSALLEHVRAGESILVTDRGVPIARIEPAVAHPDATGRLRRLERAGLVRVSTDPPPVGLLRDPGPAVRAGASAVSALLEERRADR